MRDADVVSTPHLDRERRLAVLALAGLLATGLAACAARDGGARPATAAPGPAVDDRQAVLLFRKAVEDYAALHRRLARTLPTVSAEASADRRPRATDRVRETDRERTWHDRRRRPLHRRDPAADTARRQRDAVGAGWCAARGHDHGRKHRGKGHRTGQRALSGQRAAVERAGAVAQRAAGAARGTRVPLRRAGPHSPGHESEIGRRRDATRPAAMSTMRRPTCLAASILASVLLATVAPAPVGAPWRASAQTAAPAPARALSLPNRSSSLKFFVLGDFGTGNREQYALGERMAAVQTAFQATLVITVGDNIYGGERPAGLQEEVRGPLQGVARSWRQVLRLARQP